MKNFILIVSSILLIACTPQKKVTSAGSSSTMSKPSNKGMKMHGDIVVKSEPSADGKSELPVLYFDNGVAHLISFGESKVSKAEIQQYVYKNIDIIGEIKTGKTPSQSQNLKKEEQTVEEGQYIVIYKIL